MTDPQISGLDHLRKGSGTRANSARMAELLRPECSIFRATQWIGDAWSIVLLRELFWGVGRFDELLQNTGMASNVLASRLKKLHEGGIVTKLPTPADARRYDYALTEKGIALFPVLMAVMAWGDAFEAGSAGPLIELEHSVCGHPTKPGLGCSHCGQPLAHDQLRLHLAAPYAQRALATVAE